MNRGNAKRLQREASSTSEREESRKKRFLAFNLNAQRQHFEEEREQKIAKAYQRQAAEEREKQRTLTASDPRARYYAEVFGPRDDDQDAPAPQPERKRQRGIVDGKAMKKWKQEEQRRIEEQQRERERKLAVEQKRRQHREEHKFLAKRSKRGQPVIRNVVTHLLKKIVAEKEGEAAAHADD